MTTAQSDLADLSRYVFRAPRWHASLAVALCVAAVVGVASFDSATGAVAPIAELRVVGHDAWQGIFYVWVPTIVAAIATTGVDRFLGGQFTPNRSALLALVGELLVVAVLVWADVFEMLVGLGQPFIFDALIVGLASVFAMRLLVVMAVSRSSLPVAAIPAGIQTAVAAALLFVYGGTYRYVEIGGPIFDGSLRPYLIRTEEAPAALTGLAPRHFSLLVALCALYAVGVHLFLAAIDRPWRRSFGVSVLDFLRGFIGHVAEGSRELEVFFERLGEEAIVPVTVLAFRRPGGEEKARFVLPMIHPGPMGEIGGGNVPTRIARQTDGLAFPPHATAGHDFNLVTEREVDSLLEAARRAHDRIDYAPTASTGVRVRAGEASVLGQRFGDGGLLVSTFAPGFADDIDYGVGLTARARARAAGLEDVLVADAHNSNNGLSGPDLGHVTPGSTRSFDLIEAATEAGERMVDGVDGRLRLGTAWDRTEWTTEEGIGPLGVRVAVVAVGDHTTAYVLIDGNNMEPGLRDRLVAALDEVDAAEVLTTDTHVVNTVEATNQVGAAIDHDELEALVGRLVGAAIDDLEPVEAGLATERTSVTVFGNDRTESLASTANAAVTLGGAFAVAVTVAVLAVSLLLLVLT
ncbi:DUF2070 family protein [Halalkalicoccus ordinarius]|uniref:DUF2070 family protein n=1 Tax=Halalkalicoccus ordinarius TaxID=3116651 RepID=UPI00300EC8B4